MIDANELRIGNLVINHLNEIHTIKPSNILAQYQFDVAGEEGYKPIPINEEWLFKFGFEYYNCGNNSRSTYKCFNGLYFISIDVRKSDRYDLWYKQDSEFINFSRSLMYVHELQNIYYCLTEVELK